MDLFQAMRVFPCVVDEGSFAAAARKMDLVPAVVTRHIQELERSLSARLLHRTTRKISLTQAGEGYLSRLRLILAEVEEATDQARAHSSEIAGLVHHVQRRRDGVPGRLGRRRRSRSRGGATRPSDWLCRRVPGQVCG